MEQISTHALAACRILVVEDEVLVGLDLAMILTDAGATVIGPVQSLSEALVLAAEEELTAVVLDVRLGPESTLSVGRKLTDRGIPFIVYTGQVESDLTHSGWPRCKIIPKPALPQKLVGVLSDCCGASH